MDSIRRVVTEVMTTTEIHEANYRWLAREEAALKALNYWPDIVLEDILDAEYLEE